MLSSAILLLLLLSASVFVLCLGVKKLLGSVCVYLLFNHVSLLADVTFVDLT